MSLDSTAEGTFDVINQKSGASSKSKAGDGFLGLLAALLLLLLLACLDLFGLLLLSVSLLFLLLGLLGLLLHLALLPVHAHEVGEQFLHAEADRVGRVASLLPFGAVLVDAAD